MSKISAVKDTWNKQPRKYVCDEHDWLSMMSEKHNQSLQFKKFNSSSR